MGGFGGEEARRAGAVAGWDDDVVQWPSRSMCKSDEAGSLNIQRDPNSSTRAPVSFTSRRKGKNPTYLKLDQRDSKVFINHGVQADRGLSHELTNHVVRLVDHEVDLLGDPELGRESAEGFDAISVDGASYRSGEDEAQLVARDFRSCRTTALGRR